MGLKTCWQIQCGIHSSKIGAAQIIRTLLSDIILDPGSIVEQEIGKRQYISAFFTDRQMAHNTFNIVKNLKVKGMRVRFAIIKSQDILKTQKINKPIDLSNSFFVVTDLNKAIQERVGKTPIKILSQMAFGTGAHETTRFMVQLIEKCRGRLPSFFDVGTGSGILAIVASKCGAQRIYALDNDSNCIQAARMNFRVNDTVNVRLIGSPLYKFKENIQFDFVAANLVTDELLSNKEVICRHVKKGGYLAVSGIGLEHLMRFKKNFCKLPFRCLKIYKGKKWAALLYKRTR